MPSLMINFRVSEEFGKALDASARQTGMSRSDYIRAALKNVMSNGQTKISDPDVPAEVCKHPKEKLTRTTFGINICECGAKLRN